MSRNNVITWRIVAGALIALLCATVGLSAHLASKYVTAIDARATDTDQRVDRIERIFEAHLARADAIIEEVRELRKDVKTLLQEKRQ